MAIDKELISRKLHQLEDFISRTERMDFSSEELNCETDIQDALLFRIQQAVENAIDIANHLVSGLALPHQDTAKDIFILLTQNDVLPEDLAKNLGKAVGFRNLVVHGYGEIDFDQVFRDYKTDLADLRTFAKTVSDFISKN